jgi:hypothetical protein
MLADFRGEVLPVALEPTPPLVDSYALLEGGALRLLLVNRSEQDVQVTLELDIGAGAEALTVKTLSDPIFDELLTYEDTQVAGPVSVPARAVVRVRVLVTRPE